MSTGAGLVSNVVNLVVVVNPLRSAGVGLQNGRFGVGSGLSGLRFEVEQAHSTIRKVSNATVCHNGEPAAAISSCASRCRYFIDHTSAEWFRRDLFDVLLMSSTERFAISKGEFIRTTIVVIDALQPHRVAALGDLDPAHTSRLL